MLLLFLYITSLGYIENVLHPYNKFVIFEAKKAHEYEPPVPINKQLLFLLKAKTGSRQKTSVTEIL